MDLALNNLQRLIYHKTQTNKLAGLRISHRMNPQVSLYQLT